MIFRSYIYIYIYEDFPKLAVHRACRGTKLKGGQLAPPAEIYSNFKVENDVFLAAVRPGIIPIKKRYRKI